MRFLFPGSSPGQAWLARMHSGFLQTVGRPPAPRVSGSSTCLRLVLLVVFINMNTIGSRTGDFHPISSRPCRAYTSQSRRRGIVLVAFLRGWLPPRLIFLVGLDKKAEDVMRSILLIILAMLVVGCAQHKVDTFPEWCEQITGVNLEKKYRPFWAVIFSVSFDGDAIRDDYTAFLNKSHLEKVQNRAPRMAWREGTELHLVNLSSLLVIEPEKIIEEWRKGIELAKEYKHTDQAGICLYGTLTSLFDSLHIHSMESNVLGVKWKDNVTVIPTDREKRLGKNRL
jgi:hypothetical protein